MTAAVRRRAQRRDSRLCDPVDCDCDGKDGLEVYDALNGFAQAERTGKRKRRRLKEQDWRVSPDLSAVSRIARMAVDLNDVNWLWMPGSSAVRRNCRQVLLAHRQGVAGTSLR